MVKNITATALIASKSRSISTTVNSSNIEIKRRRTCENKSDGIVGNITQYCSIQAAPREVFLYVSRLSLIPLAMIRLLIRNHDFLGSHVSRLNQSFMTFHYSSFEVTINFIILESAMKPDIRPMGTYVGFFLRKAQLEISETEPPKMLARIQ